ncbi:MAG: nodulation protein NfeD [Spirochaetia bacterium]|jgi:membrane-bound serine protease (ClpP class)|nr:nodulation protein NfeD [Spirochaetia bacterium]
MKIFILVVCVALPVWADGGGGAFVVPIHGDIEPSMTTHVRRQAGKALGDGAAFLIFDIDTFGGRVDSALQISSFIGSLEGVKTVAYIRQSPQGMGVSWSAGALIAMSCSAIYMAPGTSIGAAAPVVQGQEGVQSAGEKNISAVRAQMAALAEKNGHPVPLALAMVDYDVALVEIEEEGRISAVFVEEAERLERERPGRVRRGPVVSAEGKLLSLTAGEALRYGLSSGTEGAYSSLLKTLNAAPELRSLEPSSADAVVAFLASGGLQGILILVGLGALFLEISTPGFGIPGSVAILCFVAIFGTNAMLGTVDSSEILLFLLGIGLLVLEIFVIPGFGVAGVSGIVLVGAALVLSMQDFVIPDVPWEWDVLYGNILTVGAGLCAGIAGIVALALFAPRLRLFDRLTLKTAIRGTSGGPLPGDGDVPAGGGEGFVPPGLEGQCGKAVTVLRPSGRAEFGGVEYSVETDGAFVAAGTPLVALRVRGNHILVKPKS